MTDNNMLTSVKSETITVNENMNPDTEYTLEYTVGADDGPNNGLYLYVSYQFLICPVGILLPLKTPLAMSMAVCLSMSQVVFYLEAATAAK